MDRAELLSRLNSAWTAIAEHEGEGDVAGAREYWESCTTDQLQREWNDTVDRFPKFTME